MIPNGSLTDFIEIVAKTVGFNYILDPAVGARGSVSLFTYGEVKPTDLMTLRSELLQSGVDSFQAATIVWCRDNPWRQRNGSW